jgi:hypothetical protein
MYTKAAIEIGISPHYNGNRRTSCYQVIGLVPQAVSGNPFLRSFMLCCARIHVVFCIASQSIGTGSRAEVEPAGNDVFRYCMGAFFSGINPFKWSGSQV